MRVLSIDPGLTITGWAVSNFTLRTGMFNVEDYNVFRASYLAKKKKEEIKKYGHRPISLRLLNQEYKRLITTYKPDIIVAEDIFYNPSCPQAYVTLSMCLFALEQLCLDIEKPLYRLAPRLVKMITCNHGSADKEMIFKALKANDKITFTGIKDKETLELIEHITDAVAIGWSLCSQATELNLTDD